MTKTGASNTSKGFLKTHTKILSHKIYIPRNPSIQNPPYTYENGGQCTTSPMGIDLERSAEKLHLHVQLNFWSKNSLNIRCEIYILF